MKNALNSGDLDPASDLGSLHVKRGNADQLGSCNFCDRDNISVVFEVSGMRTVVRFCRQCLKKVKEDARV